MQRRGIHWAVATAFIACGSFGGDDPEPGSSPATVDAGEDAKGPGVEGTPRSDGGTGTDGAPPVDGGGDIDAATWTPKDLPGLVLWFDNADGLTFDRSAKLANWIDKSGNANNATPGAPCMAPGRAAGSLSGRDTLAFTTSGADGTCMQVADSPTLQFGTGDFAIVFVARSANTGYGSQFWVKKEPSDQNGVTFLLNGVVEFKMFNTLANGNAVAGATPGLNDNTFHRFGTTRRGLDLEVWLDGVLDGKITPAEAVDVSRPTRPVYIGANASVSPVATIGLVGNVAEVVAVKGTLSDAQLAELDAYFKTKHAL